MKLYHFASVLAAGTFCFHSAATAAVVGHFSFDTSANNIIVLDINPRAAGVPSTSVYPVTGTGGSNGVGLLLGSQDPELLTAGIIQGFDLVNVGITAGNVTASDIEQLKVSLDILVPNGLQVDLSLFPASDQGSKIGPGVIITGTGVYQSIEFLAADATMAQKTDFLNQLNDNNRTDLEIAVEIPFVLAPINSGAAGQTISIDNAMVSTVPEPNASLLSLFSVCLMASRRIRSRA